MPDRVCIIACDLLGPVRNGGIGTALTAFAELMVEAGNDVTILFPSNYSETEPLEYWMRDYADRGITLESLFAPESGKQLAYLAYRWLKEQPAFDIVHYHDWLGIGFWIATAKHQGLAFQQTKLVCQVHGQTIWHLTHSGIFLHRPEQIEADFLERRSVELADAVFSPSRYMVEWMESRGWKVPVERFVAPNVQPARWNAVLPASPQKNERTAISELVFFGRLETRKGLELFCEAVAPLVHDRGRRLEVTFLGKIGEVNGVNALDYIAEVAEDWPGSYRVVTNYDVYAANEYLSVGHRLAVIASLIENSPYTVLECLALGIPFVAADVGGIAELIAPEDREAVLFPRNRNALCHLLEDILARGAAIARPAVEIAQNRSDWISWHTGLCNAMPAPPAIVSAQPLVSVCISTFNRPELCRAAILSLESQTYERVQVVLIDDASPSPEARQFIRGLAPEFERKGWVLIQNEEELWTGRARNLAVERSRGDFVLLMDDDNVAKPQEVERFVSVALTTGADVLTCQQQKFAGLGPPPPCESELPVGFMPIGPNLSQGLYENCFGDLNMMVRRQCWDALGGFTDERCGCEDYELLARAVLAGYHLEAIPEILFYYRISDMALAKRYDPISLYNSFMRALRPFAEAVPEELRLAVLLAGASRRHQERVTGQGYWGRD